MEHAIEKSVTCLELWTQKTKKKGGEGCKTQQNKITLRTQSCGHQKHKGRGGVQHVIEKKKHNTFGALYTKNTKEGRGATCNKPKKKVMRLELWTQKHKGGKGLQHATNKKNVTHLELWT